MSLLHYPWMRLLRVGNLAYIAVLLLLLRFCIIEPIFARMQLNPTMPLWGFVCLLLSVVAAAAAGYVLNDIADVSTDRVNRPQRITVGQTISPQTAQQAGLWLNIAAIVLGFVAGYSVGNYRLGWIPAICVLLLLQYARSWKQTALWGNIVVSSLAALAVLIPALFEPELFYTLKDHLVAAALGVLGYGTPIASPEAYTTGLAPTMLAYIVPYTAFAFLLTLTREIVKDIEDVPGDQQSGYRTLPIVGGLAWAKLAALVPLLLCIQGMVRFVLRQLTNADFIAAVGGAILILLPLLWLVWKLWNATDIPDFGRLSRACKIIMAIALLYLPYIALQVPNLTIVAATPPDSGAGTEINLPAGLPEEVITDIKIDTILRTGDLAPDDTDITKQPEIIIGKPTIIDDKP